MKYRTPFLILLLASLPAVHAEPRISAEHESYYHNFIGPIPSKPLCAGHNKIYEQPLVQLNKLDTNP